MANENETIEGDDITSDEEAVAVLDAEATEGSVEEEYVDLVHEGKDVKVSKAEARELAMKGYDYTQHMMRLADRGREYEKGMEGLAKAAQDQHAFLQYHAAIEYCDQQIKAISNMDLDSIKSDDSDRYQALVEKRRELREVKAEAEESLGQARWSMQQHQNEIMGRRVAENKAILVKEIPGWNDALYSDLLDYAVSQGVRRDLAQQVVEAPMFCILRKAQLWDKARKGAEEKKNEIGASPKPGTSVQGKPQAGVARLREKLKKTGSVQDAARLFERLI